MEHGHQEVAAQIRVNVGSVHPAERSLKALPARGPPHPRSTAANKYKAWRTKAGARQISSTTDCVSSMNA